MFGRRKHGALKAAQLAKRLARDPEFLARKAKKLEEHARRVAPLLEAEKEILLSLAQAGVNADSLAKLRDSGQVPSIAVDVLMKWLWRTEDPDILEGVVRTLGAAKDSFDGTPLARVFDHTDHFGLRWAIANTIACVHPIGLSDWLESRLTDMSLGRTREMLAVAAGQMLVPATASKLLRRVFPELPGHCAMGLAECGGQEELAFLAIELNKHSGWVRKEIKKAINKIAGRKAGRG